MLSWLPSCSVTSLNFVALMNKTIILAAVPQKKVAEKLFALH
jgi:hypothetical protein